MENLYKNMTNAENIGGLTKLLGGSMDLERLETKTYDKI